MGEGNSFSLFTSKGGVPGLRSGGGVPGLNSRGGYLVSGLGGYLVSILKGGYLVSGLRGTQSQVRGGTWSQFWGGYQV